MNQNIQIRSMYKGDLSSLVSIESKENSEPWSEETFLSYLKHKDYLANVAAIKDLIVGFSVYKISGDKIEIIRNGVRSFQYTEVATLMFSKMKEKARTLKKSKIVFESKDNKLNEHLVLKSLGFVGRVLREKDCYLFEYVVKD